MQAQFPTSWNGATVQSLRRAFMHIELLEAIAIIGILEARQNHAPHQLH
jgi:hypothetical protein